jgi:Trk K+ transport system NAD-binding subunit
MRDRRDILVIGFSEETETLLRHLRVESSGALARVVVVDPRPHVAERLRAAGVDVICADPFEPQALSEAGIAAASLVVSLSIPGSDARGSMVGLVHLAKAMNRRARVLAAATGPGHAAALRAAGADEVFCSLAADDLPRMVARGAVTAPAAPGPAAASTMWRRIANPRFALLVAIALIDAVVFVLPLTVMAVIIGVVAAPGWLRRVARFLDDLADGRPA